MFGGPDGPEAVVPQLPGATSDHAAPPPIRRARADYAFLWSSEAIGATGAWDPASCQVGRSACGRSDVYEESSEGSPLPKARTRKGPKLASGAATKPRSAYEATRNSARHGSKTFERGSSLLAMSIGDLVNSIGPLATSFLGMKSEEFDASASKARHRKNTVVLAMDNTGLASFALEVNIDNPGDIERTYRLDGRLGQGAFAEVFEASVISTGAMRAVKRISLARMKDKLAPLKKEIDILKRVDHPNVIKLYEIFEDDLHLYLVLELGMGGSLQQRTTKVRTKLNEPEAAIVMHQIFRGVAYLHKNHICHRDLKPANILLSTKAPLQSSMVKISDFGLSCRFRPGQFLTALCGTMGYMAPEVFRKKYDEKCDAWSCGVILFEIMGGSRPFAGKTDAEFRQKVMSGRYSFGSEAWLEKSQGCMELVTKLLVVSVKKRIRPDQGIVDPWLQSQIPKPRHVPLRESILDNLRGFRKLNKFKRASLRVIASLLNETQIRAPHETFLSLDVNGDGQLSMAELKKQLEIKNQANQQNVKNRDVNGSSVDLEVAEIFDDPESGKQPDFTYTEFIAATFNRERYVGEEVCKVAFSAFDRDGNGRIEYAELLEGRMLGNLTPEETRQLMLEFDQNKDGTLDFDEFRDMLQECKTEGYCRCYSLRAKG